MIESKFASLFHQLLLVQAISDMSSMKTFVAFLLLISGYAWAAMSTVSNNAFYISHVEPTKNFMVSFLDNFEDLPASRAGTSNAIISRFHAAAKQSEFSKAMMSQTGVSRLTATIDETPRQLFGDRLRVRFQAYDEDFDLTLSVNRDIIDPQRTRVYAGVPGNLTTHIPHYTFYSSSLTDLEGEQTIASFTVLDDLRLEGMIVRDGETYSVSPVEFLQAEVTTDAKTGRSATLVSIHCFLSIVFSFRDEVKDSTLFLFLIMFSRKPSDFSPPSFPHHSAGRPIPRSCCSRGVARHGSLPSLRPQCLRC